MVIEEKKKKKKEKRFPILQLLGKRHKGCSGQVFPFSFFSMINYCPMSSTVRIEIVNNSLFSRAFRLTMGDFVREF